MIKCLLHLPSSCLSKIRCVQRWYARRTMRTSKTVKVRATRNLQISTLPKTRATRVCCVPVKRRSYYNQHNSKIRLLKIICSRLQMAGQLFQNIRKKLLAHFSINELCLMLAVYSVAKLRNQ